MADERDRIRAQREADAKAKADAAAAARQARMDELKAEREAKAAADAKARAASNPLFDPTNRPEAPPSDDKNVYYYSWIGGGTTGQWRLYKTPIDSPTAASAEARSTGGATLAQFGSSAGANTVPKPGTGTGGGVTGGGTTGGGTTGGGTTGGGTTGGGTTGGGTTGGGTTGGGTTGAGTGAGTGTTGTGTTGPTGPTLAKDVFKATLALYFGEAELAKGWMDELYNAVSKFYLNGQDVATSFNMALLDSRNNPNLKAFTDRFKGIYALQDLRQAGKPVSVPTIAEYVAAQKGMADIFSEVGLTDLATEQFTGDLIGKGNSVTTVADKISKAFQRIDMAPKAIKDTLSRYFPTVDRTTLAKTLLTGQKGVDALVDELSQYEVLAAAEQQGLGSINRIGGVDLGRAQEYARMGETFSSLTPQFSKIARALPTTSKLAGISRTEDIGQVGLERALITQSAKDLQKLEELTSQEEARFMGKAGRAELGLASQRRANRAF